MLRRRTMGLKKLIEVYEEITVSGNWTVPASCESIDVFVVGGGENGVGGTWDSSGRGGNGGECKTYTNIMVTPGEVIPIRVGGVGATSYFKDGNYQALGAKGLKGGDSVTPVGQTSVRNGGPGKPGMYAFDDTVKYPNRFGASGGGGGGLGELVASGAVASVSAVGGKGGSYGGGDGGGSTPKIAGDRGGNASWYGAGGGGGGKGSHSASGGYGGAGYQGIVILHYRKYQ